MPPFNEHLVTPPSVQSPSSAPPGPVVHYQPKRHQPPSSGQPADRRNEARSDARRARVVALLQQAVNEECFGSPDYAKGERPIEVTEEHADAIAAMLVGASPEPLEYSEREELERLRNAAREQLPNPNSDR